MKKTIIFTSILLATFLLTAFGYMNWRNNTTDNKIESHTDSYHDKTSNTVYNFIYGAEKQLEPDFFYDVDSRFLKTITKEDLHKAKSIHDIFLNGETKGIESFRDVNIVVLPRDEENVAKGDGNKLNSEQLKILQSVNYSADICIEAFSQRKNLETGKIEEQCFVYYITIVPEKESKFKDGQQALIQYLKKHSKEEVANVTKDKLKPGKVRFTITKDDEIKHVELESTSGYSSIDDKMIKLIMSLTGEWEPAKNSTGEKVDQELVISFGMVGC